MAVIVLFLFLVAFPGRTHLRFGFKPINAHVFSLMLQQMFVAPIRRMIRAVPGNMVLVDAGSILTILLTTPPLVQYVKKWVEKYQIHSIIKHLHSLLSDSCNTQVSYTVLPTLFSYYLTWSLQNGF